MQNENGPAEMKTLQMPRVLGAAGDGRWARVAVWGLVCVLLRGGPYNKQRDQKAVFMNKFSKRLVVLFSFFLVYFAHIIFLN